MTISNTQALAAEELLRTVLSSESPGELILIDANLRLLRQRPEAFLKGRGEEADLVGWGSPEAVALLLTPLLSLLSTFFMGFSKKLGEELAASAVAKRTKKPVVDEPARARRRAVRIFKKECLRLACTPRWSAPGGGSPPTFAPGHSLVSNPTHGEPWLPRWRARGRLKEHRPPYGLVEAPRRLRISASSE